MKRDQPHNFYPQSPPKGQSKFKNLTTIKEEENQRRMSRAIGNLRNKTSFNSANVSSPGARKGRGI